MAYIGRGIDNISQIEVLDIITFTNSAGPYNILKSSVAFTPSTPQSLLIEIDGIIQAPSSYTIAGSTITFGVSMASGSTMNSILHFGTGIITTPADLSVTTAKIVDNAITNAKVADNAITNAKVADDAIGIAELSATGTASASNYLRGDNSWASIAADTNDKVSVSANDTTPSYLNGKLVAGTNISLTEGSDGGNETLTAAFTGNLNASVINAGTVATARLGSGTADGTTFLRGDQTYAEAGGGAWTHIKTVTASSDSAVTMINGTSDVVFDATYSTYALVITNLKPATNDTHLYLRYVQGGSVISTNKYGFFTNGGGSNQGVYYSNADNQTEFKLNGQSGYVIANGAEGSLDGIVYFSNPASTAVRKNIWWQISWQGQVANTQGRTGGGGFVNNTTANNGFSVLMNSGNIASGKFKLYGITS